MKKAIFVVLLVTFVCAAPSLVFAIELSAIQNAIKQSGARWEAMVPDKTNPMRSGLLKDEDKKSYPGHGLKEMKLTSVSSIPSHFDWRNVGGKNYVTPVRDQGACGSCWAFSVVGAMESLALITLEIPGTDLDLSEQTLVSCSILGSCGGGEFNTAAEHLRKSGVPKEACYTYRAYNTECGLICNDSLGLYSSYNIQNWVNIRAGSAPDINVLKSMLVTLGPLSVSYVVYDDFYSYSSGIYSHVSGKYSADHGVLLVGYDDREEYFIVKNSWGLTWGEEGYFRIAYSEMKNDVAFANYVVGLMGFSAPQNRIFPEITVNGQRNPVVKAGETISIAVRLDPVNQTQADNKDWWIWMSGPDGTFGYDVAARSWQGGLVPIKLPVFQLNPYLIWDGALSTPGYYHFYFAIDDNNDGIFDGTWQGSAAVYVKKL
jgi:C1A family cysteine protease